VRQVYVANDIADAHMLRALLEQAGIAATVLGEHLPALAGEIPFAEAHPTLWVEDSAVDRALGLIEGYQADRLRQTHPGLAWHCSGCGEEVEPQFSSCWNCGGPAPNGGSR
jgi:hypothetical protein